MVFVYKHRHGSASLGCLKETETNGIMEYDKVFRYMTGWRWEEFLDVLPLAPAQKMLPLVQR